MQKGDKFKFKICLVGESAVGKTSTIRRFVFDEFGDKYLTTIGIKITKKEIKVKYPRSNKGLDVNLMIWDIMGQQGFRQLLQAEYFQGARGIIGVCDVTRRDTLLELNGWIKTIQNTTKEIPIIFLGNKCDLIKEQQVDLKELQNFAANYTKAAAYLSSAKTGQNVEHAFKTLTENILEDIK
jgi:small GTP-binding protein